MPAPMLKVLFRAIAVALLALAVPVQGFAAASAGICMALGHHDGGSAHQHGSANDSIGHGHGASVDSHEDHGGSHDSQASHCAPCVSCCAAAAIAPSPSTVLPERTVSPLAPAPLAFFYGVALQRLDRPPLAL